MTTSQEAFLTLHARFVVTSWQWIFGESMLRARTERGIGCVIWRDELDELVDAGLVEPGHGVSVAVTDAGRSAVAPQRLKGSIVLSNGDAT